MESSAHYLFENLKLQLDLHGRLLSLLEKKRRAVIERDLGGLEAALTDEEGVVEKIKYLTEIRTAIMEKFAERFGLAPDEIKLGKIGEDLPQDMHEAFGRTLRELSGTARRIVELDTLTLPKTKGRHSKRSVFPCATPASVLA